MIELQSAEVVARTHISEVRVLEPTSLLLSEQRIALIGPNGSGKSTLAKLVNGLVEPTAGSVRIRLTDGSPWLDTVRDGALVRRGVGFVFTNPAAQLVMPTVLEDLSLSLRRTHPNRAERRSAALGALERFGLQDLAERSVHSLSGGQQQLLAIAGVLATKPSIVVADEPTTLLDLTNSRSVSELLLSLPQQVLVATHDLELAAACDRALVIMHGRVAFDSFEQGTTAAGAAEWYRANA